MRWTPGQSQPHLPPVVPFDPGKVFVPEPVLKPEGEKRTESYPDYNFTAWITSYNKGIPLAEAELISRTIVRFAREHDVDPNLVVALVAAESAFRRNARSPVGAQGLGQLMPGTAAMLGVSDPWDPDQNLSGTVRYLARQLRRWDQDASLALASYNAGPGAVQRYGGIPPYRETQEYVHYVLKLKRELSKLQKRQTSVSKIKAKRNT
jgi:soluble lytic murein transglycosylase-like protein